jgi:glycosyltransferase involved in cell wall biosynthesis
MRILYVAYPLLPVSGESCGGAEQMLWALEREMNARGHQTTVAASEKSVVAGRLFDTGYAPDASDRFEQREAEHTMRIIEHLRWRKFDLIHDESGHFWRHAARVNAPVLATLHLPRTFYPTGIGQRHPDNLVFNCVSRSQARSFSDVLPGIDVVQNGIAYREFPYSPKKRDYLLWMGRICPEKGTHVAIEVARRTNMPLVIAGQVYPFRWHEDYYEREVRPHLDGRVWFAETPTLERKLEMLSKARAVLLTSSAEETSSLVAMEAMACGTAVVAFRRGAFAEVVADGSTGFVVDSEEQMVEAIHRVGEINPLACRLRVEREFSAERMADEYEALYERVIAESVIPRAA